MKKPAAVLRDWVVKMGGSFEMVSCACAEQGGSAITSCKVASIAALQAAIG
ncbi:hypothetical protein SAMN05192548_10201 [Paraburkholderia terricola]|uniref:Uncharacterized protein n=1 Tax=Paraburkholderia terricola TaxID=169427 RepID=A0A1M6RUR4_9BURK|nr:hypothetical protein SAMN05192547_1019110 [Paraburkholderia sediminicola]SHK36174.1 hypothetical protein SAMN05192548_10201 [Paraburkholderia terricola]